MANQGHPSDAPAAAAAQRLNAAIEFAVSAGEVARAYFGGDKYDVQTKRDGSHVTTADRESEQRLRRLIAEAFPGDGILGEEFGEQPASSGWRWIIDPIDGTASFIHGVPLFGTLVACERDGRTIVGVIHMPALGETVYASQGAGAWHVRAPGEAPRPARVSSVASLADAMMCTTSYAYFKAAGTEPALQALHESFGASRGWSDCYAHVLCATGRIDAVVDPVLFPWDIAPMQVIYPEAGGRATDWAGRTGSYHPTGIATNGRIHDELLGVLRPFSR